MNTAAGARATSRGNTQLQADAQFFDASFFEASITNLFIPWLVDAIPDSAWQTLQARLGIIIHKILLSGKVKK